MNTQIEIPSNETVAQKALRLLEPIPAEQWIVGKFSDRVGACCMLGHYSRLTSNDPNNYEACNCWNDEELRPATEKYLIEKHNISKDGSSVNNGTDINGYTEPIIKDRVIHLLKDMVRDGF